MKYSQICDEVVITLRQIMRAITLNSKKLLQRVGLTNPQMLLMKEILRFGQVGTGVLAKNVNLSQATVTSILDRLVAKELVTRTRSTMDKRKVFVELSERGKEILENAPPLLQEEFVVEFDRMEEWEQMMMLANLKKIAGMMHAKPVEEIAVFEPGEIAPE